MSIVAGWIWPARSLSGVVALLLVACGSGTTYAQRHCANNTNPRVNQNRGVALFSRNYVYVSPETDPTVRSSYIAQADALITKAYDDANKIFSDNGINLMVLPIGESDPADDALDVIHSTGLGGSPDPVEIQDMERLHQADQQLVAVHWAEWLGGVGYSGEKGWGWPPCGNASCDQVVIAGMIHHPIRVPGHDLAHELGHYFGLEHDNNPPDNLMAENSTGNRLTSAQREQIWQAINSERTNLFSQTCDGPPETPNPMPTIGPSASSTP